MNETAILPESTKSRGQSTDEPSYTDRRLAEGGLRLVTGSQSMLTEEFARYEAERLGKERSK